MEHRNQRPGNAMELLLKTINLRYGSSTPMSSNSISGTYLSYYVTKYWDKSNSTVPTSSNNSMRNLGPGWVAWRGRKDSFLH